jgi:hypothetical protein
LSFNLTTLYSCANREKVEQWNQAPKRLIINQAYISWFVKPLLCLLTLILVFLSVWKFCNS